MNSSRNSVDIERQSSSARRRVHTTRHSCAFQRINVTRNSGGRPAGSITAGWFLREFVDGFPWAHLDIAGTAYTERDAPDMAKGPTAAGVRLFSEFLLNRVVA